MQAPVIITPVCEPRVATPEFVQETRVETSQFLQEPRMVLPTLAIANPIVIAPSALLPIVALTSPQYPPPPGLLPLPNTDQPNHLLGMPLSKPTIPVVAVPKRQSPRPHRKRTSDIYVYSAVIAPAPAIPAPYIAIVHAPPLTHLRLPIFSHPPIMHSSATQITLLAPMPLLLAKDSNVQTCSTMPRM